MDYRIRPFRTEDAEALLAIARSAIQIIGSQSYSADQVSAWAARHNDAARFIERAAENQIILVTVDARDEPCAYAILERDGHLDHLYCDPGHSRQGLADELLDEVERQAQKLGIARLSTEASELARPAFERAGYRVVHRRDFEVDGVPLHNFAMEKLLAWRVSDARARNLR